MRGQPGQRHSFSGMARSKKRLAHGPWLLGVVALSTQGACRSLPSLSPEEAGAVVRIEVDDVPVCMGTVVDDGWVLTARHCVTAPDRVTVLASRLRVRNGDSVFVVDEVSVQALGHEFDRHDQLEVQDLAGADIALVRVPSLVASLQVANDVSGELFALGSQQLRRVAVLSIEERQVFTTGLTCQGDSGGPLFDAQRRVVGVASWRTPGACGTGTSVFTRVSAHRGWIDVTVR